MAERDSALYVIVLSLFRTGNLQEAFQVAFLGYGIALHLGTMNMAVGCIHRLRTSMVLRRAPPTQSLAQSNYFHKLCFCENMQIASWG